jgi:hypothetical protein
MRARGLPLPLPLHACARPLLGLILAVLISAAVAAAAQAQDTAPTPQAAASAASAAPAAGPLPDLGSITMPLPRPVRAASALIRLARQRLALVVGNGRVDAQLALPSAARDTQAVAAALRAGGFVVMVREDLGADELRANLREFARRLRPGGIGFLYFTGLAAQVDGRNVVLPRGLHVEGDGAAARLRAGAVPLQELADAVQGDDESPRFIVVDAAYAHPALGALGTPGSAGLAPQALPPGLMGLFASAPRTALALAEPEALPAPAPTDPRRLAASLFAREVVQALLAPHITGPDALRRARETTQAMSQGRQVPVIVGDSQRQDDLADPDLLEALPRSPEDLALQALKQTLQPGHTGATATATTAATAAAAVTLAPASAGPGLGSVAGALAGTAAGAAVSAAGGIAATAALGTATAPVGLATAVAGAAVSATGGAIATPPPPDLRTQPQRTGGERPAYVPRVNPYGYAEGDTFMYRHIDTWKDEDLANVVQSIDSVLDDGDLLADGQLTQMDPQGRLKRTRNSDGSTSVFEPCQELWWSNPKRGQRRTVEFTEYFERADHSRGQTEWKGSLSVGSPRSIELPAGEFEVLPIEGSGWFNQTAASGQPLRGHWSRTVWYSPQLGHPVAIDIEDRSALGTLLRRERTELLHAQTSRSAPPQ